MGQPRGLWHLSPQRGGYHPNSQDQGQGPPGNAEANQREMAAGKGGDYGREGEAHGWGKRGREVKEKKKKEEDRPEEGEEEGAEVDGEGEEGVEVNGEGRKVQR